MLTRPFLERIKPRLLDGRSRVNKQTSIPATLEPPSSSRHRFYIPELLQGLR